MLQANPFFYGNKSQQGQKKKKKANQKLDKASITAEMNYGFT